MAINEIIMFSDNYYETGKKSNNKTSSSSNFIFQFSTNCNDKIEFTVKSVIGDVICKTKAEKDAYSEFYANAYAEFDKKDNLLYDEFLQKKENAYQQYQNDEISKSKYNRLCKQYLKEYKDAKLSAWLETQAKMREKADEMGLKIVPHKTTAWINPF